MKRIICLSVLFIGLVFGYNKAIASNIPDGFEKVRCTCYLQTGNKTADGTVPYDGIIASNCEHMGDIALLYTENMVYIGMYEVRDLGGHKDIKNGTRIDMFCETEKSMKEFISAYGDYVLIKWIKAEG